MRLSLAGRLVGAFLAVTLASVGGAGFLADRTVRRDAYEQVAERLRYEVTMTGQMTASALFAPLAQDDTSLQGAVRDLAAAVNTHLSVLTPDGFEVADSEIASLGGLPTEGKQPEVDAALRDGKGSAVRGTGQDRRLWVAETITRDGKLLGIARASVPLTVVDAQAHAVRAQVLRAALAAVAIGGFIALVLSFGIARPVRRLVAAARRIGGGDLTTRVDRLPPDEIGDLGQALNDMAANLRAMVAKLDERNTDMHRVLDAIDQGLLVASLDGSIEAERSAIVDEWFGTPPKGALLWSLFAGANPAVVDTFELAWLQFAEGYLPVNLALDQLPKRIAAGPRVFSLAYTPIVEVGRSDCQRVLVSLSDITAAIEAERKEEEQKDLLEVLGRTLRDRRGVMAFLREADALVLDVTSTSDIDDLRRKLHTLKGSCAVQGVRSVAALCHELESTIEEHGSAEAAHTERLLARWRAFRASVDAIGGSTDGVVVPERDLLDAARAVVAGAPRDEIAEHLVSWTMTNADVALANLGERAKELAERLGKGPLVVRLEHDGTRLERDRWSPFFAALVHAIRNSVDHGIETATSRADAGKPPQATLTLRAQRKPSGFLVEVADDGKGIDWSSLREKLTRRGLPATTHEDLIEGLYVGGVSTSTDVTDVSGRGMGLSALREAVTELGGTIEVASVAGQGTTVSCRFPAHAVGPKVHRVALAG